MILKVGSVQFSYKYGDQLHMPYTIAVLVSYLKSDEIIKEKFNFLPTAVDRSDYDKFLELYKDIDILLCSCYIWNWEITKKFSEEVKKNTNCLVIFGGPQIPEDSDQFLKGNTYVDLLVHNEGESVLRNIFLNYLKKEPFDGMRSVSTKLHPQWEPEPTLTDINSIPSPYITNTIWDLINKNAPVKWLGIMETARGCPYGCYYCAWGASSYNKVRKFDLDRVYKEIDFFSDNRLTYIDCSDANFGMFERDVQITDYIVNKKKVTGFPTNFKPCWDKKVSNRIKYIAKALKSVDLLVSVGCSLQSLDQNVLKINNRKSIPFKDFIDITEHFKKDGSQCYTEIIRGLPGETLNGFIDGLNRVIFESNIDTLFIYNCSSFESTMLNSKEFKDKYKIKTIRSPVFLSHASLNNNEVIEYDDIITDSYSFTKYDLKKMYLYSWYVLVFQSLGLIKYITRYIHDSYNIDYNYFYYSFVKYCEGNLNSLFGREYHIVNRHGDDGFSGKGWNHLDPSLGSINWPIEEASFLRIIRDKQEFKTELINFIKTIIDLDDRIIDLDDRIIDLVNFQVYTLSYKNDTEYIVEEFNTDWKFYFTEHILRDGVIKYSYKNKIPEFSDNFDWNTKCIWYGRRKINYKANLEDIAYYR